VALSVLGDCEAVAALRFRHLGEHFLKPGNSDKISISRMLHFVHNTGLLNACAKELQKRSIVVKVHWSLWCQSLCVLFECNLFYSILFLFYSTLLHSNSNLIYSILSYSNSVLF